MLLIVQNILFFILFLKFIVIFEAFIIIFIVTCLFNKSSIFLLLRKFQLFRFLRKIFCSYFSILLFSKFFHIKLESIFFSDFSIFFEWNKSIIKLLIWFLLIELVNIFHVIVSALFLVCLERQWLLMSIIICTHASPAVISSCRCCPIWKINKSTLFPFFLIFYNL